MKFGDGTQDLPGRSAMAAFRPRITNSLSEAFKRTMI
jgi:hypothetical protein